MRKVILLLVAVCFVITPVVAMTQTVNAPCVKTQYGYWCKIGEYQVKYEAGAVANNGIISVAGPEALIMSGSNGVSINYGHITLAR